MVTKTIVFFSVKEKKPEEDGEYIVRYGYGGIGVLHIWHGHWNCYGEEHLPHEMTCITHWAYKTFLLDPDFEQEDING